MKYFLYKYFCIYISEKGRAKEPCSYWLVLGSSGSIIIHTTAQNMLTREGSKQNLCCSISREILQKLAFFMQEIKKHQLKDQLKIYFSLFRQKNLCQMMDETDEVRQSEFLYNLEIVAYTQTYCSILVQGFRVY